MTHLEADHPLLNTRRFFRNRFERFAATGKSEATPELDGSILTLHDLCHLLADDEEPFPFRYRHAVIVLSNGSKTLLPHKARTYGNVARAILRNERSS